VTATPRKPSAPASAATSSTTHASCRSRRATATASSGAAHEPGQRDRALGRRPRGALRAVRAAGAGDDERAPPVLARPGDERRRRVQVVGQRGGQAPVERGGDRELEAGLDLEGGREGPGAAGRPGRRAQVLVARGELGADARGLAARGLHALLRGAALAPRRLAAAVGLGQRGAALGHEPGGGDEPRGGLVLGDGERGELALELLLALAVQALELGLQRGDPLAAGLVRRVRGLRRPQRVELAAAVGDPVGQRRGRRVACSRRSSMPLRRRPRPRRRGRQPLAALRSGRRAPPRPPGAGR
jgi:hypothetical protein